MNKYAFFHFSICLADKNMSETLPNYDPSTLLEQV